MSISNILDQGVRGMLNGQALATRSVARISEAIESGVFISANVVESIVDLDRGQHQFEASAKVIRRTSGMLGSLLDKLA